jgi:hypothetical protein
MLRRSHRPAGVLLLATASFLGRPVLAAEPDLCVRTARAAGSACRNEANDDFWIAVGNCENDEDRAARRSCRLEARQERREGAKECREQLDAREALCGALGPGAYDPPIDPANFATPAAAAASPNRFLPLVPGARRVYEKGPEVVTVDVTHDTRVILGVTCTVVRDVVHENGVLIEDTQDYFAQDLAGNVWYFGEIAQNFDENGFLADLEGSWIAGEADAKPGIVMKASPMVDETYRQEFALGDAEDAARVLSVTASASVPAASCNGTCVQTLDFSPLEPDAIEHKFYAPDVGLILEVDPETGERLELVSIGTI